MLNAERFRRQERYFNDRYKYYYCGHGASAAVALIKGMAESRGNKLTHAEYEAEATWSTRKYMPFVMQRISVATQLAAASEIRQALGVGLAAAAAGTLR